MKITLRAAGVIRSGPERTLIDDYIRRANGIARNCGFHSVTEHQVDMRAEKNRTAQTRKLLANLPASSKLILLDERGTSKSSRQISASWRRLADDGVADLVLMIGPADGFDPDLIPKGTQLWSFGSQTWPHKLARIMAAEQIYRALSILSGSPYHRD